MKRIIKSLLILTLILSITGCFNNNPTYTLTVQLLKDAKKGNYDKALEVCTKEIINSYELNDINKTVLKKVKALHTIGGNQFNDELEKFIDYINKSIIKSYDVNKEVQILESTGDKDNRDRYVQIEIEYIDIKHVSNNMEEVTLKINNLIKEYSSKHQEKVNSIYTSKGEKSLQEYLYDTLSKEIFHILKKDYINKLPTIKKTYYLGYTYQNKWILQDIETHLYL